MAIQTNPRVMHWSTGEIPASERFDYFANALASAVVPMRVESAAPATFDAAMTAVDLGGISLVNQTGTKHRSFRNARDDATAGEHSYHLILNLTSSWTLRHGGDNRLDRGDAVLTDSRFPHDLEMPCDYEVVHLKFSPEWLKRWVSNPDVLVGRRLSCDSSAARPLTSYVACLSPHSVIQAPLPVGLIVDQIGAMLAMCDYQLCGVVHRSADIRLRDRIRDCIVQRCGETDLSAETVAAALDIPVDVVHRSLMAESSTFAQALMQVRARVAVRMLSSSIFCVLELDEIRERAGFATVASMSRTLRSLTGSTATAWRQRTRVQT